jgi:Arc/MetJ family transcription regulator
MRTTISLDPDVVAAAEAMRRERDIGLSDAVNELVRAGLRAPQQRSTFHQRTADVGLRIDVSNVAEALDALNGLAAR